MILNPKYQLSTTQISSNLSGETIILDHQAGVYFGLNEVGTFVWEKIKEKPQTFDDLKTEIFNEYEIDENTAETDLKEILDQLVNEKLVEKI